MSKVLLTKLRRDIWTAWGRIVLMVVAIGLSLVVFSAMLYARTLVQSNMTDGYIGTNPASARITFEPGVQPAQIEVMRDIAMSEPKVIDVTLRSVAGVKLQKEENESETLLQLFIAAPDDPMRIAKFKIEQGSWPPAADGVLVEHSALEKLGVAVGGKLNVTGFDGQPKTLKIAGSVRDQSLAPAGEATAYGYASTDTLQMLGRPPVLNQLAMTVADQPGQIEPSRDRDTIVATASNVAEKLKAAQNVEIEQVAVPPPYEHPHQGIANTILTALMAFGALSLLLSGILIATIFNGLLTQHIPQIGIMKAIGARSASVLKFYAAMVLLVVAAATALALVPGVILGRALAEMLLLGALNMEISSLAVPLWAYGTAIAAGVAVPLLIALPPLVRASGRTVREALDDRGVTDGLGRFTSRFYTWFGHLRVSRTLLMAFRNVFRRRARFLLSVGLLAVAGAVFVSGLNLMAAFQAIPSAITEEQRWDVQAKLAVSADAAKAVAAAQSVPGVTTAEAWNTVSTSVQYAGELNVTRTYPDQGHGSVSLSALPPESAALNPPKVLEGRWLEPGDTDAIVLPGSIRNSLPGVQAGDTVELAINEQFSRWQVVGIVQEFTGGGSCPCVTQEGFWQATGKPGQTNVLRIITDRHDEQSRLAVGEAVTQALSKESIKTQAVQPIDAVITSAEEHSGLLIILIMLIAFAIGTVGLIGLGSTMSTNVIERTREFGVMSAIGAPASTVRRLVVFEGVFIALVSCVAAAIPALALTIVMDAGLGAMFFNAPLPVVVSAQAIALWVVLVVTGATLATLAPASKAARLTVREALAYL